MPDDRNGVPPGPPSPFGRARGTNGVHRDEHADLPTRSLSVAVADGPTDLVAVQADDELVNALGSGAGVAFGDRAPGSDPDLRRNRDEHLVAMLAAWRAEIEAEPIPELIDLDTAVAAVVAGMKSDELGTRRKRAGRMRHLAPLAAAAAIIVAAVSGVGLGSKDAMPGDTLWAVQKVVNPERAESVETKLVVESRLDKVRTALSTGDTDTAARELQAISTEIPAVRGEEGQPGLAQEQEYLVLKLAETPPGEPADLSTPPKSKPTARSTTSPAAPPPASSSASTSASSSESSAPGDPSVSKPVDVDPRRRQSEALVPQQGPGPVKEGPATSPGSSTAPDVTKAPGEPKPAPEQSEGSGDTSTAPASSGDKPAPGGAAGGPTSGSAQGEATTTGATTATGTTASGTRWSGHGHAGTSIDATATATTS
jgi:hypothetical protein